MLGLRKLLNGVFGALRVKCRLLGERRTTLLCSHYSTDYFSPFGTVTKGQLELTGKNACRLFNLHAFQSTEFAAIMGSYSQAWGADSR